jgi:hypothetical protein
VAKYTVDISSYANFRANVFGKGYDVDGAYGYQCVDGISLLLSQLTDKRPSPKGGAAKGYWDNREQFVPLGFTIITDKTKILRGDITIFGNGTYGHVGYADTDYTKDKIAILGENQGGTSGKGTAAYFSVKKYAVANILGGIRFTKWNTGDTNDNDTNKLLESVFDMDISKVSVKHTVADTAYNMRDKPTTQGKKIALIPKKSEVIVLSGTNISADGYVWNVVIYADNIGWCVI